MNDKAAVASSVVEGLRNSPCMLAVVVVIALFVAVDIWQMRTISASMERRDHLFAQLTKDCAAGGRDR